MRTFRMLGLSAMLLLLLAGCYNTPVRHLSSDIALLKVGKSTVEDVLVYLGNPDERQEIAGGEVWFYRDKETTLLEKAPYVGGYFGEPEYRQVMVRLQGGVVTECRYTSEDADDLGWADDFDWQEKKE